MEQCEYCQGKTRLTCPSCGEPTCASCLITCKRCGQRYCEACMEDHEKECRPEYRPTTEWPGVITLPCGCELTKEKAGKTRKSETFPDGFFYTYTITSFCGEHDPSLWENFEDCDGNSFEFPD